MPDLRQPIQSALQALTSQPLRMAALSLLDTLGYLSGSCRFTGERA
jgi:hypothetical protein